MIYVTKKHTTKLIPYSFSDLNALYALIKREDVISFWDTRQPTTLPLTKKVDKEIVYLKLIVKNKIFSKGCLTVSGELLGAGCRHHHYRVIYNSPIIISRTLNRVEIEYLETFCNNLEYIWFITISANSWTLIKLFDQQYEIVLEQDLVLSNYANKRSISILELNKPSFNTHLAKFKISEVIFATNKLYRDLFEPCIKQYIKTVHYYECIEAEFMFIRNPTFYNSHSIKNLRIFKKSIEIEKIINIIRDSPCILSAQFQLYYSAGLIDTIFCSIEYYENNKNLWGNPDIKVVLVPDTVLERCSGSLDHQYIAVVKYYLRN